MATSLKAMIDTGKFLNYVNSFNFTNSELDEIGMMLNFAIDGNEFTRNASLFFGHEKGEFLASALANSGKQKEGK